MLCGYHVCLEGIEVLFEPKRDFGLLVSRMISLLVLTNTILSSIEIKNVICCKKLLGTKTFSILHSFRQWHLVKLAIYYAMHKKLNLVLLPPPFSLACLEARAGKLPFLPFTSHRAKRKAETSAHNSFLFLSLTCMPLQEEQPPTLYKTSWEATKGARQQQQRTHPADLRATEKKDRAITMEEQEGRWVKWVDDSLVRKVEEEEKLVKKGTLKRLTNQELRSSDAGHSWLGN